MNDDDAGLLARRRIMREVLLATDRLHKTLWQAVTEQVAREDISAVQWLILSDIAHGQGGTLTDYVRWLARDPGALSRAISGLTARGLLASARSDGDRRRVSLALTPLGQALHARLGPRLDRLAAALEQGFSTLPMDDLVARMDRATRGVRERPRGSVPTSRNRPQG